MEQKTRKTLPVDALSRQDRFLRKMYGTALGRGLLKPLTAPWLSKLVGKFLSTRASCIFIKRFVRKNRIDLSLFEQVKYRSYNEFFFRKIRPELRPVDMDPRHFISPCDSKLTVMPITPEGRFMLKHTEYTVASLLKNDQLAEEFTGGYAMVFRLTVDDYHRYCYSVDGEKAPNVFIPGKLHTVNPIANDYFPIYKENTREYTVLHNEVFGDLVMMEVGALLVGKIVNHHEEADITRGQEKGYFQFGGSTVVVLIKAGKLRLDQELLDNSAAGLETVVRYGEGIGEAME